VQNSSAGSLVRRPGCLAVILDYVNYPFWTCSRTHARDPFFSGRHGEAIRGYVSVVIQREQVLSYRVATGIPDTECSLDPDLHGLRSRIHKCLA
jgi:hypothetical protein